MCRDTNESSNFRFYDHENCFLNIEVSKEGDFFALPVATGKPYRLFEESSVIFFLLSSTELS